MLVKSLWLANSCESPDRSTGKLALKPTHNLCIRRLTGYDIAQNTLRRCLLHCSWCGTIRRKLVAGIHTAQTTTAPFTYATTHQRKFILWIFKLLSTLPLTGCRFFSSFWKRILVNTEIMKHFKNCLKKISLKKWGKPIAIAIGMAWEKFICTTVSLKLILAY